MKGKSVLNNSAIITLIIIFSTTLNSQVLSNLHLETNFNYYITLNKSELKNYSFGAGEGYSEYIFTNEYNEYNTGYSIGLGIQLFGLINTKFRVSKFDLKRRIDYIHIYGEDNSPLTMYERLDHNEEIKNLSIGLIQEFLIKLKKIRIPIAFGIERQYYDLSNTIFIATYRNKTNYALHYSLGVQKDISKRVFASFRIFSRNNITGKEKEIDQESIVYPREFYPISYGFEFSISYILYKFQASSNGRVGN